MCIARLTGTPVLAYLLALLALGSSRPVLVPLTALLVVRATLSGLHIVTETRCGEDNDSRASVRELPGELVSVIPPGRHALADD